MVALSVHVYGESENGFCVLLTLGIFSGGREPEVEVGGCHVVVGVGKRKSRCSKLLKEYNEFFDKRENKARYLS